MSLEMSCVLDCVYSASLSQSTWANFPIVDRIRDKKEKGKFVDVCFSL